jgi:putative FmdB family regulatory protein
MPYHSYKCQQCENEFEVFYTSQSAVVREEPEEKCPKCQSVKKERQIPKGTSHILKGKGWFKDSYGK